MSERVRGANVRTGGVVRARMVAAALVALPATACFALAVASPAGADPTTSRPTAARFNLYFGDLHAHTGHSDGAGGTIFWDALAGRARDAVTLVEIVPDRGVVVRNLTLSPAAGPGPSPRRRRGCLSRRATSAYACARPLTTSPADRASRLERWDRGESLAVCA